MTINDLLNMVVNQLRDLVGSSSEYLWADEEIIDVYANDARNKLFINVAKYGADMIIDDTTDEDTESTPLPLCSLSLIADTAKYSVSDRILDIKSVHISGLDDPLTLLRRDLLTSYFPNWREMSSDVPKYYTPDLENDTLVITPPPASAYTCYLTVSRFPLDDLSYTAPTADLGFRREYQQDIVPWIIYRCLTKKDVETDKPQQAEYYRQMFEKRCKEIADELRGRNSNGKIAVPCTMVV